MSDIEAKLREEKALEKEIADYWGWFDLSVRATNCLVREKFRSIEEVQAKTDRELLRIPNLGRVSIHEIRQMIASLSKPDVSQGESNMSVEVMAQIDMSKTISFTYRDETYFARPQCLQFRALPDDESPQWLIAAVDILTMTTRLFAMSEMKNVHYL